MAVKLSDLTLNKLRVAFHSAPLLDVRGKIAEEMERLRPRVQKDMRLAIAVGSRGLDNYPLIVKTVVDRFIAFGAKPFLVPAMGSHGGATAEGQKSVLRTYGITEESMGVPILSSMKVVSLGTLPGDKNVPLYMDEHAWLSDGVFVINRVKTHTDFHGPNESGIAKMLVIGLGKHAQALAVHEHLVDGLRELIPAAARAIVETGKILGGLAILEDGYDRTSVVKAVYGEELVGADAELLIQSKAMMPSLPFDAFDVLLVDYLGKNISGTGMDTNIIGRISIRGVADARPNIRTICLFDLTPQSHGNAIGIGLSDVIPQRLYDKINWQETYENVLTSRFLQRGFVPIVRPTDRDVIETGIRASGYRTKDTLKLVRIKDTLHIDEIYATDALLDEIRDKHRVEILERNLPLTFDENGELEKYQ